MVFINDAIIAAMILKRWYSATNRNDGDHLILAGIERLGYIHVELNKAVEHSI